jgi:SAM-dependent methyltransferase
MTITQKFISLKQRSNRQKILTIINQIYKIGYLLHAKYHSFDFDGYISKEKLLEEASSYSAVNATVYQGCSNFYLKILLKEALSTGIKFENFIDIGSGKGKVCIYAAKYFKFMKIVGIEFSWPLVEIANRNLANTNYKNIEFINADATEWRIPNGNTMVFLFNPFNEITLKSFISSNIEHFKKNESLIIYANAIHGNIIEEFGFDKIIKSSAYSSAIFKFKSTPPQLAQHLDASSNISVL